jgi:hypothetical protein
MKHFKPALTALAIALLAAGPAGAQAPTQWSGVVAPDDTVEVLNIRGTIQAVVSTDGRVHVNARPSDPSVMRVDVVEHAGGVKVCALPVDSRGDSNGPCTSSQRDSDSWPPRRNADLRVDIEVSVPRGVRLSATSVAGDIRTEQLQSDVKVTMVSGRVVVESAGFPAQITSVSGDVRLEVPTGANADFHATTLSGDIDSDVVLTSNARNVRLPDGRPFRGPGQNVRATIGSGGPDLRVTTVSGDIEVRQR